MEIVKRDVDKIVFKYVKAGEVFTWEHEYFIKLDECPSSILTLTTSDGREIYVNAVNLQSGTYAWFTAHEVVQRVYAKLEIS